MTELWSTGGDLASHLAQGGSAHGVGGGIKMRFLILLRDCVLPGAECGSLPPSDDSCIFFLFVRGLASPGADLLSFIVHVITESSQAITSQHLCFPLLANIIIIDFYEEEECSK